MRTAGIDYDLGRVVICSLPLTGNGLTDAVFTEELMKRDAGMDLAQRYKLLYTTARTAWSKHTTYACTTDVLSVCLEAPGSGQPHIGLKMMGAFGAIAAAIPSDVALCSMMASEWKKELGLPPKKAAAHEAFWAQHVGEVEVRPDEHATDALCIALAWRRMQVAAQ